MREILFRRPHYKSDGTFLMFMFWGCFDEKAHTGPSNIPGTTCKPDEQYTGLRDNKDVRIFEGDILDHPDFDKPAQITIEDGCTFIGGWDCIRTNISAGKVIGNVHQNPGLL